ncbi:MAG TPA: long-chain fatty acid--CoA ligase, partial [Sneathiellales bacterium]|nr:long-chain fatty acid--CoA ligase [Sneathiellales bacterium]
RKLRFADLTGSYKAKGGFFAGKSVALCVSDINTALPILCALDGVAKDVALFSVGHKPDVVCSLLDHLSSDVLFADNPEDFTAKLGGVSVYRSVEDCPDAPASDAASGLQTRWILTTSGTTGVPKLVSHTLDGLTRTTRIRKSVQAEVVWGLLYDYARFAGLQVVLQSVLSGSRLVCPADEAPLKKRLRFLKDSGCSHLSATPTMWRKIVMTPPGTELQLRQITLGGEIADDTILQALARDYPEARISHIFASTEAGVGFSVTDGKAGFPVEFLENCPSGIEINVRDGQLWVKNTHVADAYIGSNEVVAENSWVDTGDSVEIKDGRVRFLGRASGVINVGGNKVHPETVEAEILKFSGVRLARVYAKSNPFTGALVMADVVGDWSDPDKGKQDLKIFLRASLENYMVPARIKVVDGLGENIAGKLTR